MKTSLIKSCIFMLLSILLVSVCEARVVVNIGLGPIYSTPYGSQVSWVPGHWDNGYWIPGQYIEYAGRPPGAGFVWVGGGFDGDRHHWRHGYWHRH